MHAASDYMCLKLCLFKPWAAFLNPAAALLLRRLSQSKCDSDSSAFYYSSYPILIIMF